MEESIKHWHCCAETSSFQAQCALQLSPISRAVLEIQVASLAVSAEFLLLRVYNMVPLPAFSSMSLHWLRWPRGMLHDQLSCDVSSHHMHCAHILLKLGKEESWWVPKHNRATVKGCSLKTTATVLPLPHTLKDEQQALVTQHDTQVSHSKRSKVPAAFIKTSMHTGWMPGNYSAFSTSKALMPLFHLALGFALAGDALANSNWHGLWGKHALFPQLECI